MKSNRPIETEAEAIQEIKKYPGMQFDPTICKVFVVEVLENKWE